VAISFTAKRDGDLLVDFQTKNMMFSRSACSVKNLSSSEAAVESDDEVLEDDEDGDCPSITASW
jgi:hypothetical protein